MGYGRELLRHLDLKHLRQLAEVADKGSIRAAAESLAITQPALSRSIRAMETQLRVKLVDRSVSGTELTPAGEILLKYARIIDANLALAEEELRGHRAHCGGTEQICIGMSWLAESIFAPRLVDSVLRNRPDVRLTTTIGDFEALAPGLMSGKIELYLGTAPIQKPTIGISSEPLVDFAARILARAEHPLARKGDISLEELANQQWILPVAGTLPRIKLDDFFLRRGTAPPEPMLEVQPLSPIIRTLLLERDLVTMLPLAFVRKDIAAGRIKPLSCSEGIVFTMHLTHRQLGYQSPTGEFILREIEKLAGQYAKEAEAIDQ